MQLLLPKRSSISVCRFSSGGQTANTFQLISDFTLKKHRLSYKGTLVSLNCLFLRSQTKARMALNRINTAPTRQQDFETLKYTGSSVPAETAYNLSSTTIESKPAVCNGECQSAQTMLFGYNRIDELTLTQSISEAPYRQSMQIVPLEEPTRLLRPCHGPAAKPKRFFRTFWRGLSKRALSVERLNSSMNE